MQVGGYDIVFSTAAASASATAQEVFDVIKQVWPRLRFEDANDNGPAGTLHVSFPESKEFFLYRHLAAYRAINKYGVEDYLANDFLHFILNDWEGQVTLCVGSINEEIEKMVHHLELECGWLRKHKQAGAA